MSPADRGRPDGARRAFRLPAGGRQLDAQLDDELRFHLQERVEELMEQGRTRAEAEAEAVARFGTLERWRDATRTVDHAAERGRRRAGLRDRLRREVPRAARALLRAPGFALVAVLTLALGLGATTAIFAVLDRVVLRPLPYPAAERLYTIQHAVPLVGEHDRWGLATVNYFDFREHVPAIASIGIYSAGAVNVTGPAGAERARSADVSASLLETLGAAPILGRLLAEHDNAPGATAVAVLGHDYWRRRFGEDRTIVGRTISIDARPVEIVGVLPPDVHLPDARVDVWTPMTIDPARIVNQHTFAGVLRLADGATPEVLLAQLRARERLFPELYPDAYSESFFRGTGFAPVATSLRDHVIGDVARTLWILFAAVGLVLLIACAHVANLFLVRIEARRRETAVRAALGAARGDFAWHFLTETLLLATVAAALGLAIAWAAVRLLVALAPAGLPRLDEIALGPLHVAFAVGLALLVGVVFGVLPLARTGVDLATLRDGGRGLTLSGGRHRVRATLVVAQVALSLVLLVSGALMLQSAVRLRAVPPGFDATSVVTFSVPLPYATYAWQDYAAVARLHRELQRRVAEAPGVVAVGGTRTLPMEAEGGMCSTLFFEKPDPAGNSQQMCLPNTTVAPGYFEAMRIPIVRGAAPTWDEVEAGRAGVVVSRSFAERFWPGEDPIGQGLRGNGRQPPYMRVVGVADDVRMFGVTEPPADIVYFPMVPNEGIGLWGAARDLRLVVRTTTGDAGSVLGAARRAMAELDPDVPLDDVRTMEQVMARSLSRTTLAMLLLAVAAGMALLLSAIGIYGVVSYLVGQRRGEIGIRMALGAGTARVRREVVWGSVRLALLGVAVGLVGAVLATRVLGALLYDVSPTDPATLGGVALLLVLLAAVAAWVPARRASRVDPTEALRA